MSNVLLNRLSEGDVIIGITSNGAHSNGFSLIRKIFQTSQLGFDAVTPWNEKETFG